MIKKMQNLEGVKILNDEEQRAIKGGICIHCYDQDPKYYCLTPNGCCWPSNSDMTCPSGTVDCRA